MKTAHTTTIPRPSSLHPHPDHLRRFPTVTPTDEWQVCAARGRLPGQDLSTIKFAYRPGDLKVNSGPHPLGSCNSYAPNGCGDFGYGSGDIFYLGD